MQSFLRAEIHIFSVTEIRVTPFFLPRVRIFAVKGGDVSASEAVTADATNYGQNNRVWCNRGHQRTLSFRKIGGNPK